VLWCAAEEVLATCFPDQTSTADMFQTRSKMDPLLAPATTTSSYAFIFIELLKLQKFNFRHQVNNTSITEYDLH
jgi:hypothetical protein